MKSNETRPNSKSGTAFKKLPPLKFAKPPIGKQPPEPESIDPPEKKSVPPTLRKKMNEGEIAQKASVASPMLAGCPHSQEGESHKKVTVSTTSSYPQRRRLFWVFYGVVVIVLGMLSGAMVGYINHRLDELPTIAYLEDYRPWMPSRMFAGSDDTHLIAEFFDSRQNRERVHLSDLSPWLEKSILAMEDNEFYNHPGINLKRIAGAIYFDLKNWNRRQGGSTITIQLAEDLIKNGHIKEYQLPEMSLKSFNQKFWEIVLALKIEKRYTKKEILEFYFNQVFLGGNIYGVARAAEFYFGKDVSELSLKECALFTAMLPAPNSYSPIDHPDIAQGRTQLVLRVMLDRGVISEAQYNQAVEEPFNLRTQATRRKQLAMYPYYSNAVLRMFSNHEIKANTGMPIEIYGQGVDIYSTVDEELQQVVETALQRGIIDQERVRRTHGREWGNPGYSGLNSTGPDRLIVGRMYDASILSDYDPDKGSIDVAVRNVQGGTGPFTVPIIPDDTWLDDFDVLKQTCVVRVKAVQRGDKIELVLAPDDYVQGAIVLVQPSTGKILAMSGGYDFNDKNNGGEFIRAIQATTVQPGSAFKPLLYSAVLSEPDKQWTLVSTLKDEKIDYGNGWVPQNFEGEFFGPVSMLFALTHSLNAAAVWTLDNFKETRSAGIRTLRSFCRNIYDLNLKESNLTIALGSSGITPIDLAQAYAVIANGGNFMKLHLVDRVYPRVDTQRQDPNPMYQFKQPYAGAQRMTPQTAYLVTYLLRSVVEEGTGTDALELPFYCVGKTGTTDYCTYAWFAGYAKDLLCVVYVGYDEFKRSLGYKRTGSKVALPIWMEVMEKAFELRPHLFGPIDPPPGIVMQKTCLESGFAATADCPNTKIIPFVEGTQPLSECPVHGKDSLRPYQSETNRFILNQSVISSF